MNITLKNGQRCGMTSAPSSKSHAQRLLICAGLGASGVTLDCGDISKDIAAAASCVQTLCADVTELHEGVLRVEPCAKPSKGVKVLHCGESGSTLRFLIPVCGALGESVVFKMEGRLSERPLSPLDEVLTEHGMTLERIGTELHCSGKLTGGEFEIAGNVSSQFISGLLFALPLLDTDSTLTVTGKLESSAYIAMTENALCQSGIEFAKNDNVYAIPGNQRYRLNEACTVEGDLSNAAFFLCMGALSDKGVTVKNIPEHTSQGDKKIIDILRSFGADVAVNGDSVAVKKGRLTACTVDASEIPDLVPVVSVVAAAAEGDTHIINAARVRLKESDRLMTTATLLCSLGASVEELPDGLIIHGGKPLHGGTIDSFNDHRIAMSAAVAACICTEPVTVTGCECVNKSFPRFWENFSGLEFGQ